MFQIETMLKDAFHRGHLSKICELEAEVKQSTGYDHKRGNQIHKVHDELYLQIPDREVIQLTAAIIINDHEGKKTSIN